MAKVTPEEVEWKNPLEDPDRANTEIKALLSEDTSAPVQIDLPPDDLINLPGGLVRQGKTIKTAIVKELNGEDEEALARASQSMNPFHFLDRMLKCGVVQIGDETDVESLLRNLLIGDREALILGIRKATYGDVIDIDKWVCSICGAKSSLSMQIGDIPVKTMTNPAEETVFKVDLRKGGSAEVRLANGEDQLIVFENSELTQAQRETILISRCVLRVTDSRGRERSMQGYPSLAREMSVPDRHAILNALRDNQPGPKYDEVKYKCETCGEDTFVAVGLSDLFLDFGWF